VRSRYSFVRARPTIDQEVIIMDYKQFFGLKEHPFRLTPDPDFFFPSDSHREALETLLYSIRSGEGFVQITGIPGTGKTLLLRTILRELGKDVSTALILNPRLSPSELLRVILEDLGLDLSLMNNKPKEALIRYFRQFLLERADQGIKTIIIIDEAQNLPTETMEELRLLSNLETDKEKLLQIILVGQLELEEKLKRPELKQLHQRITIRYRLKYLSREDTGAYIYHRLRIAAGGNGTENISFPPSVLKYIHNFSAGTPRLINIICERSLMSAFVEGKKTIEKKHAKKAVESIRGDEDIKPLRKPVKPYQVAVFTLLLVTLTAFITYSLAPDHPVSKSLMSKIKKEENRLKSFSARLSQKEQEIEKNRAALQNKNKAIRALETSLSEKNKVLKIKDRALKKKETGIKAKADRIYEKEQQVSKKEQLLRRKEAELTRIKKALSAKENKIAAKESKLKVLEIEINKIKNDFSAKETLLSKKEQSLEEKEQQLQQITAEIEQARTKIKNTRASFSADESQLAEKESALQIKEAEIEKKETLLKTLAQEINASKKDISETKSDYLKNKQLIADKEQNLKRREAELQRIQKSLQEKEKELAKKESEISAGTFPSKPVSPELSAVRRKPGPPSEVFSVPAKERFVSYDLAAKKASLWEGTNPAVHKVSDLTFSWPYGEGFFIVGRDDIRGDFVFNHMSFFNDGIYQHKTNLWPKLAKFTKTNMLPLIAYNSAKPDMNGSLSTKKNEIKKLIADWETTWRSMDIDRLIKYYGSVFTSYYMHREKPIIYSRDQLYLRKKEVWKKSGYVSLDINNPIFFINPVDPSMAMAVFYQKYKSKIYRDQGTKVLYLKAFNKPGDKTEWKIVGKLWLNETSE